jgi:hypothetical protein
MAKGKGGSGKTYTSKGERKSSMRTKTSNPSDKMINKQRAWLNGSNPWITIENPNKEETNKRFIRVRMNDLNHGSAKDIAKNSYIMK